MWQNIRELEFTIINSHKQTVDKLFSIHLDPEKNSSCHPVTAVLFSFAARVNIACGSHLGQVESRD
jgi:hypothetical protein